MRIVSWNVNGLRAMLDKGLMEFVSSETADLIMLQETKVQPDQIPEELARIPGLYLYFSCAERKGYSGVLTWSRFEPDEVWTGFGIDRFDCEGRILATRYKDLVVYNLYFPNGGQGEERLQYKLEFYAAALEHFQAQRDRGRMLVLSGDFNTAHNEIDIARPKENENNSGFMRIERDWIDRYLAAGYIDTFRHLHPTLKDAYSWWSYRAGARPRNIGWRLDYHFITPDLLPGLKKAAILDKVTGSDHCPVVVEMDV